jgi:hypothetical protein
VKMHSLAVPSQYARVNAVEGTTPVLARVVNRPRVDTWSILCLAIAPHPRLAVKPG